MKKVIPFLFLTLLAVFSGNAQTYNLSDILMYAMNHSPRVEIIGYQQASTNYSYRAYRASLLPQLQLTGNLPGFNRTINNITQPDGTIQFVPQRQAFSQAGVSFNQNINPLGGSIFLSSGVSRFDQFGGKSNTLWQSSPLVFGYNQPLFQFNQLKWQREMAELNYDQGTRQIKQSMEQLLSEVTGLYFDLYIAQENMVRARRNELANDSLYTLSTGRYNVGKISENELLQIELNLMTARNEVESSERNISNLRLQLKQLIGDSTGRKITMLPPAITYFPVMQVDTVLQMAWANGTRELELEISRMNAERVKKQVYSDSRFNGNLSVAFGLNQTAPSLDASYQNLLDRQSFTINYSMPAFTWGKNKADRIAADNQYKATTTQIELNRQDFEREVRSLVASYNQLTKSLTLAAKADTIALRRYEVIRKRYLIGKVGITDLYIAQNEKDAARIAHLNQLKECWSAYFMIRRLTLEDFNVLIMPDL